MVERFTDRARKVTQLARQEAQRCNRYHVDTEHILAGMVKEGSGLACRVLKNLDVDLHKVRRAAEKLAPAGPSMITMGRLSLTFNVEKVLEYAITEAQLLNHNYIGTEHLLLGLLRVTEGVGAQVLMNFGLKLEDIRKEIRDLLNTPKPPAPRIEGRHQEACQLTQAILMEMEKDLLKMVQAKFPEVASLKITAEMYYHASDWSARVTQEAALPTEKPPEPLPEKRGYEFL